jgi:hypothetical protein
VTVRNRDVNAMGPNLVLLKWRTFLSVVSDLRHSGGRGCHILSRKTISTVAPGSALLLESLLVVDDLCFRVLKDDRLSWFALRALWLARILALQHNNLVASRIMKISPSFVAVLAFAAPANAFVPNVRKVDTGALHATSESSAETFSKIALASLVSISILSNPLPAMADGQTEKFKLPPIDTLDTNRCKLISSNIGQANAARDKLYDLRQCKISGSSAVGYDLSGVIMTDTDATKADFTDAYFSKGYLRGK